MLKLYGFPLSNYYNKVKLALLEKGVPFEEVLVSFGSEGKQDKSPLGKVPYIETEQGFLCESQAIVDYIEARWPTPALIPADPWQAAKVREIITYCDLHVELCARQLYSQAFFGGTLPEKFIERVKGDLIKNLAAFKQVAKFAPYAAGDTFTVDWLPDSGATLTVRGKVQGAPLKEAAFFNALLRIWLGPNPADWKLKDALLGKPS